MSTPALNDIASRDTASRDAASRDAAHGAVGSVGWQRLWLSAQHTPWRSLALIPIGDGVFTPPLAGLLARVGREHRGEPLIPLDATRVSLSDVEAEIAALGERTRRGERVILALPSLLSHPPGLELARASDAAILCVALGSSSITDCVQVIEDVGRDHILGSIIVRKRKETS